MTFETSNDFAVHDTVAYALDGLVTMLGSRNAEMDSRGLAAMLDLIRGHLNNLSHVQDSDSAGVHLAACRSPSRRGSEKARLADLTSIIPFKSEFVRTTCMDNETVVMDVRDALNALNISLGEMGEKPVPAQQVWALVNVTLRRLDDYVIGQDLAEAIAEGLVSPSMVAAA